MLINYGGEYPFKMTELYDLIELSPKHYSRWIKLNLIESFYPYKDYKEVVSTRESTPKDLQLPDNQSLSLVESG